MTELFFASMRSLTILSGQTESRSIDFLKEAYDAEAFTVVSPANLDGKTYTWLGSVDGGVTYMTLEDTQNTNIVLPGAGKGITYNGVFTALTNLKIKASGAVSLDITFQIGKNWRS